MLDVIIVGAGPYGISLASYAIQNKLEYKLIGHPMDFWTTQMPQNMFIRTPYELVQFPHPQNKLTIQQFAQEKGIALSDPLPRPIFVDYALWYAEKSGVGFTPELVTSIHKESKHFVVKTDNGTTHEAKNVVIATGIQQFIYLPEVFQNISSELVTHALGYSDFNHFNGQRVAVIGSGQSAWEAAALLYEANADVELIYRKEKPIYGGNKYQEILLRAIGNVFYKLPQFMKEKLLELGATTVPIARFLRSYVEGKVTQHNGVKVVDVIESDGKVLLSLSNDRNEYFDHVIVASGFKMSLDKLPFLQDTIKSSLVREETPLPKLNTSFESSIPGLYFAGPLSSHSHGPTFRFILGLKKTANTIISSIKDKK
ncbi:NAD(P)-binding domain-containing protein [Paenibacillus sp. GXUN7292]|uniref:NAD(P)-binding domain-containing protein n=1 Tax=Paenibacillus sp. GXUN7292 TaxID=3422499 RepID=UPI003D7DC900